MTAYVYHTNTNERPNSQVNVTGSLMPARAFFFVTVDQVGPEGFLVRQTYSTVNAPKFQALNLASLRSLCEVDADPSALCAREIDSLAEATAHVLATSRVTSHVFAGGEGKTVYVDIAAARRAGAKPVAPEEIGRVVDHYLKDKPFKQRREGELLKSALGIGNERTLKAPVMPPEGIFSKRGVAISLGFEKWARVVQVFGIAFTGYDIANSSRESLGFKHARPIDKSVLRNLAGWEGSVAGRWADSMLATKIGAETGALLGFELAPGARITGAVGGIAGGAIGFYAQG
jgi:hypothetical protein